MFRTILVPLDGSALAERALPYVIQLATAFHARPILLRVVPNISMPSLEYNLVNTELMNTLRMEQEAEASLYLKNLVASDPELAMLEPRTLLRHGEIAEVILDTAEEVAADTIVMGTHGRSGFARWVMGSVADRVLRASPIPVLLIRAGMIVENIPQPCAEEVEAEPFVTV